MPELHLEAGGLGAQQLDKPLTITTAEGSVITDTLIQVRHFTDQQSNPQTARVWVAFKNVAPSPYLRDYSIEGHSGFLIDAHDHVVSTV